jgi:hypothetical protein
MWTGKEMGLCKGYPNLHVKYASYEWFECN